MERGWRTKISFHAYECHDREFACSQTKIEGKIYIWFWFLKLNLILEQVFGSLSEAEEATSKIEREMLKAVQEKAPDLSIYLQKNNNVGNGEKQLGAIAEESR